MYGLGSLSWSAAARVENMNNMLPVQLVRVEQKKLDASLPLHSVKGQVCVQAVFVGQVNGWASRFWDF